jgi:TolA-binding protein
VYRIALPKSFVTTVLVCLLLSSCSWLSNRKSLFGNDDSDNQVAEQKQVSKDRVKENVSRTQYDQLLTKYERLINKNEDLKLKNLSPGEEARIMKDLDSIRGNTTANGSELIETVDVFGDKKSGPVISPIMPRNIVSDEKIEGEITALHQAERLVIRQQHDKALDILKELENSSVKQIKVRAKFLLAELLFQQKEYDLSLQIFEDILHQYAFSGVILKTLGRLIVCTKKLNLEKKHEQYFSLLHDFFEAA